MIRSSTNCSTPETACIARDRVIAVWKVATTGSSRADSTASSDRLGVNGSCTWITSKSPDSTQRRTRAADTGPKESRATEPLYRTGTARPPGTT